MKTTVCEKLQNGSVSLAVIGMGYVGLPMAVTFAKKVPVIGFDINKEKIAHLKSGQDETNEVLPEELANTTVRFTSDEAELEQAEVYIIAVPTPVDVNHAPECTALTSASQIVGRHLKKGCYVIYESTVYPGMTEEICVPILQAQSGLSMGKDFKVGYSPERINPGDKEHSFENILKVVSGCDKEALEEIAGLYGMVVKAGVYPAESIKVAEAAKVIENTQRDINIAFMNELSVLFHKMGIDTKEVLAAASTKWNFLSFQPGLVGGHCIGVDPYYLTYKAEQIGYHPQVILAGRYINDGMGSYIAKMLVKRMIALDLSVHNAVIGVFGITFKENCPDIRNSKVFDIVEELEEFGAKVVLVDSRASDEMVKAHYGMELTDISQVEGLHAIVVASCHEEYARMDCEQWRRFYRIDQKQYPFFDVKGMFSKEVYTKQGFDYWRL